MKSGIQIRPLSPNNVSVDCKVWLDGQDSSTLTLDGTYVNNWACKGSLGADVCNTNADTTRPTYDASTGRVTFTAANSTFLQSAAFGAALIQPNTVFIVYKITGGLANYNIIFDGGDASAERNLIYIFDSKFRLWAPIDLEDGATNANDNIHCAEFNGANSNYWINGVLNVSGNAGGNLLDGITLGAKYNSLDNFADCEICEVIVFGNQIPEAERVGIFLYLKERWNI